MGGRMASAEGGVWGGHILKDTERSYLYLYALSNLVLEILKHHKI